MAETNNIKIIAFTIAAIGHTNPMSCILHEIVQSKQARVICYGMEPIRTLIEKTGAEYREFKYSGMQKQMAKLKLRQLKNMDIFNRMLGIVDENSVNMANMIEEEKPDLVFFDELAVYAKFAMMILRKRHGNDKHFKMPLAATLKTELPKQEGVYPNKIESAFDSDELKTLRFKIDYMLVNARLSRMCIRHGFKALSLFKLAWYTDEDLNISPVIPELQPRSHLFDKTHKFVGICLKQEVRSLTDLDPKMQDILDKFEPINPIKLENLESVKQKERMLIYVSLGTGFNFQVQIFTCIIESLKLVKRFDQMNVVISIGPALYEIFREKIEKKEIVVPENILLSPFVPQIEILQRAFVFISHCGLNGTSEAIHHGVPLICIPITADQPRNSYRVADELGLGIRLDKHTLTKEKLINAISEITNDNSYHERMIRFAAISREYNGAQNAKDIILNYIMQAKDATSTNQ